MSTFPGSPRLAKGGIVLLDPTTGAVVRVIVLQYNPDTVSRTLQIQGSAEQADHSEALRLKGPPVETIKLEAELDLTDQLELGPAPNGLHPQLAALEIIAYPTSARLNANNALAAAGTLEIVPMEAPLSVFVWSKHRVLPVRLTDFSITEDAFDPDLNPIRAKVSLGMRVLNVNDLGFSHKGSNLFMAYLQNKERLASLAQSGTFTALGIGGIP